MKSKFWNYVLYNYLKKIKSKTFIGFNIFLVISGLLVSQLGTIATWFNDTFEYSETVYVIDETNEIYPQFEKDFVAAMPDTNIEKTDKSPSELDELVKEGDIVAYFTISYNENNLLKAKYVANDFTNSMLYTLSEQILTSYNQNIAMEAANLNESQLALLKQSFKMDLVALDKEAPTAEETVGSLGLAYLSIILIFMFSYMYSVYAGQEIMYEKTSRVMEIIITSISPIKQLYGKIVYNTLYALTQLLIFVVLFAISIQALLKNLPADALDSASTFFSKQQSVTILYIIIFAIVAYLIYLVAVLILSSIITSIEEYQIAIAPIMIIGLVSFYIGIFGMASPEAPFIKVMSYIPFFSPYIMPLRISTMTVTTPEILISIALNLIVIVLILAFGANVYKNGVLNYSGDSVFKKFKQALKKY